MLGDTFDVGRRHVDGHRLDRLGCAAVGSQCLGEPLDGLGLPPLSGEDNGTTLGIGSQRQVIVAGAREVSSMASARTCEKSARAQANST